MGARHRCSAVAHRPSFPTWALAQVWILAEAQPHTRLRAWEQNCASGRGDESGILYWPSLPLLMGVHLQGRMRDQRAQAKVAAVVVVPHVA